MGLCSDEALNEVVFEVANLGLVRVSSGMIDLFQRWRVWIMIVAFPGHESETKKDMLGQGSEVTEVDGSLMSLSA